jgi:hypothetical protein
MQLTYCSPVGDDITQEVDNLDSIGAKPKLRSEIKRKLILTVRIFLKEVVHVLFNKCKTVLLSTNMKIQLILNICKYL